MEKNSSIAHEKTDISKSIILAAIIGGLLGISVLFLSRINVITLPATTTSPFNSAITIVLLGILIGGIVGVLASRHSEQDSNETNKYYNRNNATLEIKEEQLNTAKKWMETGEVKVYREIFYKKEAFTVPIKHEELVIEKKSLKENNKDTPKEVIRIPISEEQVEFLKHKVELEDVSVYKEQIQDIKHIEGTLKKEKPVVRISGDAKVIDKK